MKIKSAKKKSFIIKFNTPVKKVEEYYCVEIPRKDSKVTVGTYLKNAGYPSLAKMLQEG